MRKFYLSLLALVTLVGFMPTNAAFKDIKLDLTNGKFLTSSETSVISAGVAVAADGTASRVAADAADAVAVITGKYHSDQHGLSNFKAVVPVEGPVKITYGGCNWGGNVTVKDAAGNEVVPQFTTSIGACWSSDKPTEAIVEKYYAGEATTLTIEGGAYVPYFAVEASAPVTQYTVSYTNSDAALEGVFFYVEHVRHGAVPPVVFPRLHLDGHHASARALGDKIELPVLLAVVVMQA